MCVLMMATRQLALINKTGQVHFEINITCRMFVDWIRNMIHAHFSSFFSSMMLLSYDRVIAGYLTRQVATTFMATCARHYAETDSVTEANAGALKDMETAPITLQSCNVAVCNAVTHLCDSNLLLVNQLIRDRLHTPVVPPAFIVSVLRGETIDMGSSHYDTIFAWVSQMVQNRQQEAECVMGYIAVSKLGSHEDYSNKETYLESYFGVAKNNYYTYLTAVKECCSKTFDLTGFLNMDTSMLDFSRFIGRLGVGGDGLLLSNQRQNPLAENHRCTYLFMQNSSQQGGPDAQRVPSMRCWVNLIQHLLVTSLQGGHELHADNIFTFGASLTEFIFAHCTPQQTSPAGNVVLESFQHVHDEVLPLQMATSPRPEYFVRTVKDHGALESGVASELPAIVGAHPLEDVIHLGAWIQLHTIIHNGVGPKEFCAFEGYNGRPPELVLGRRYPLVCAQQRVKGTLQLSGTVARITLSEDDGDWEEQPPVPLEQWWTHLRAQELMVAPLVFRRHAAFMPLETDEDCAAPWVAINYTDDERQFLTRTGQYVLSRGGVTTAVPFDEAHARLISIGSHILVHRDAIRHFGLNAAAEWVVGCLRYPENPTNEERSDANQHSIYVTIKLKGAPSSELEVRIVYTTTINCRVLRSRDNLHYAAEATQQEILSLMAPSAQS